jgi:hypothetical protein
MLSSLVGLGESAAAGATILHFSKVHESVHLAGSRLFDDSVLIHFTDGFCESEGL